MFIYFLIGSLEGVGAAESIMEQIALELGIDPTSVKLNNTNVNANPKIPEFWTEIQHWGDITNRQANIKKFNEVLLLHFFRMNIAEHKFRM